MPVNNAELRFARLTDQEQMLMYFLRVKAAKENLKPREAVFKAIKEYCDIKD